jgi:dimethylhistidine N-methyltransferase
MRRQGPVVYEPLDVSESALAAARKRIEQELKEVAVLPQALDYTNGLRFAPAAPEERRLVLYIGSSIGNFEPEEAARLLRKIRKELTPGDGLLLGVDMVKDEPTLLAAYDDAAGVTADFNLNMLARLNRELGAEFELDAFGHLAVWNEAESRIEMHIESRVEQSVLLAALEMRVEFAEGERIHTENSYKYRPGQAEAMLDAAGFTHEATWTDENGWFAVCLGAVV